MTKYASIEELNAAKVDREKATTMLLGTLLDLALICKSLLIDEVKKKAGARAR